MSIFDALTSPYSYEDAFRAQDITSQSMRAAISEWFRLYYDRPVTKEEDPCQRIAYTIVNKLTKTSLAEYKATSEDKFAQVILFVHVESFELIRFPFWSDQEAPDVLLVSALHDISVVSLPSPRIYHIAFYSIFKLFKPVGALAITFLPDNRYLESFFCSLCRYIDGK